MAQFEIHPSVVFRLGEELITDEVQALAELIKNAYDADASYVKVEISTVGASNISHHISDVTGFISVEDDGTGMTKSVILDSWLTISNSSKVNLNKEKQPTNKYGRTPQGDKGLGRLGTQRLGSNLEIFTKPVNENKEYNVSFSWTEFSKQKTLSAVPVELSETASTRKYGTTLVISDLKNSEVWGAQDSLAKLQVSLARLISPFKQIRDFRISLRVNGVLIDFEEIAEDLRKSAQLRYLITFDSEIFYVLGMAKLEYFNPADKDKDLFRQIVTADHGKNFFTFLMDRKSAQTFSIKVAHDLPWFIQFELKVPFLDLQKLSTQGVTTGKRKKANAKEALAMEGDKIANPGPFSGEIDYFQFEEGTKSQNIFNAVSEYREYIKSLSGVRIYRDGFGIRTDEDWLSLRSAATSGRSIYVLRPDNTLGYIEISALANANLKETTSREGFIINAYYKNFMTMMQRFVTFSGSVQSDIRRAWLDFRDDYLKTEAASIVHDTTPEGISKEIELSLNNALAQRDNLAAASTRLEEVIQNVRENGEDTATSTMLRIVNESVEATHQTLTYLDQINDLSPASKSLSSQIELLREQLSQTYETMSLGLTAEALSHEFNNVTNALAERTDEIFYYMKSISIDDRRIFTYIEYVRSSISALRKQLNHFTPSLKYLREKKEDIGILGFIEELREFYGNRFRRKIVFIVDDRGRSDFIVRMNRGKLTQVVDNIVLNSEYWLLEDIRQNRILNGQITVEIRNPRIIIWDNGRGIDQIIEDSLFEPFVTMKSGTSGRGLGLFIVQQLLDSEGCTITLLDERNQNGRRFKFEIDLKNKVKP